jgi:RNase P subunit RPR2
MRLSNASFYCDKCETFYKNQQYRFITYPNEKCVSLCRKCEDKFKDIAFSRLLTDDEKTNKLGDFFDFIGR